VSKSKTWPKLFKKTSSGKIQEWEISVYKDDKDCGVIQTEYGLQGGKKVRTKEVINQGKNEGRSNSTTPYSQALAEADASWEEKRTRKKYSTDATGGESGEKRGRAPMLSPNKMFDHFKKKIILDNEHILQPKLDGFRCLAFWDGITVELVSRQGKTFTALPHVREALLSWLEGHEPCVLDGELWTPTLKFQKIASAIKNNSNPPDYAAQIQYHVYDMPMAKGYGDRLDALEEIGKDPSGVIHLIQSHVFRRRTWDLFYATVKEYEKQCVEEGFEGAMLRTLDCVYEHDKRSQSLLKVKSFKDEEFKVMGFRAAKASAVIKSGEAIPVDMSDLLIPVLVCKMPKSDLTFEVTAPGTLDEKRDMMKNVKEYIGKQLTVKYFELTDGGVPRMPVAKAFRD
jgi:ATP-dependent DNA ligase